MGKSIRWRQGVPREVQGRGGVKVIEYRCAKCGRLVFDNEIRQLVGCYEKQDIFKTGTMICCGRCGQSVGVIAEK